MRLHHSDQRLSCLTHMTHKIWLTFDASCWLIQRGHNELPYALSSLRIKIKLSFSYQLVMFIINWICKDLDNFSNKRSQSSTEKLKFPKTFGLVFQNSLIGDNRYWQILENSGYEPDRFTGKLIHANVMSTISVFGSWDRPCNKKIFGWVFQIYGLAHGPILKKQKRFS